MWINLIWYFVVYSFCGWVANEIRTLIAEKKFCNKGFLASPFCLTYGICSVICYVLLHNFVNNLLILFIASTVLLSVLTILIGVIANKLFKFKLWDFSNTKFSIGTYLTLPYALLLGVLGVGLVRVFIPILDAFLTLIPTTVSLIIVSSICLLILIDFVFSLITTVKLLHRIKNLSSTTDLIDKNISEKEISEIETNYNKLFTDNILRRRLALAYPDLKTTEYVKELSNRIEQVKIDNMKEYTQVFDNKEEKPFAFGFCFTKLFYLFVIGSFLGTVCETIWALATEGRFEIRVGMVYGPFIPVYGGGACFLTIVLYKLYKLNDTLIYIISAVVGASFEYICSWCQEMLFGTISWDYSDTPFNLDGRTNLMYALIWGLLGLVWVRYLYPWTAKLIEKMPKKSAPVITTVLIIFMVFNGIMSCAATYRWVQRDSGVSASNSFEEYLDEHFNDEHMKFLFPNMKDVQDSGVTSDGKISSERPYINNETVIKKG